jgi:DNA helicase-2/ATP-dependent DNA helicase PcrA
LRVIHSPSDDLAFEAHRQRAQRGLGDATVQLLRSRAQAAHPLPRQRLRSAGDDLKPKARTALRDLLAAFDRWRAQRMRFRTGTRRDRARWVRLYRDGRTAAPTPADRKPQGLVRSMEDLKISPAFSSTFHW